MKSDLSKGAEARLKAAFLEELKTTPYRNMKITRLTAAAGVNRTTFYKCYPDVGALYLSVCYDFTKGILGKKPKVPVTDRASLIAYSRELYREILRHAECLRLLGTDRGNPGFPYIFCRAFQRRLEICAKKIGETAPEVYENLSLAADFLAVRVYVLLNPAETGSLLLENKKIPYDFSIKPDDNLYRIIVADRGGSRTFHELLVGAYVKLCTEGYSIDVDPGVTELLRAAGMSRTVFYRYYKDFADFKSQFYKAAFLCAADFMIGVTLEDKVWSDPDFTERIRTVFHNYTVQALEPLLKTGRIIEVAAYVIEPMTKELERRARLRKDRRLTEEEYSLLLYVITLVVKSTIRLYVGAIPKTEFDRLMEKARLYRGKLGL